MGQKLDKIIHTTSFEAYKNYLTIDSSIAIPAVVVPNGDGELYSATVDFTRGGTRADIYVDNGTSKALLSGVGARAALGDIYQFTSFETINSNILYLNGITDSIYIEVTIENNTGGPITLVAQTLNLTVVQYDAPITAL